MSLLLLFPTRTATTLTNTAEGTNATAVGATGTPNAFSAASVSGTGATLTYDNAHTLTGATAVLHHFLPAMPSTAYVEWSSAAVPATVNAYARYYVYLTALPTVTLQLMQFLSNGSTVGALWMTTTGTLQTTNNSGGVIATSVGTVPLGQWVRIEYDIRNITAGFTGTVEARIYSGANLSAGSPDANGALSNTAQPTGSATINDVRFGLSTAVSMTSTWDFWQDEFGYSDVAMPAPVVLPGAYIGWGRPL